MRARNTQENVGNFFLADERLHLNSKLDRPLRRICVIGLDEPDAPDANQASLAPGSVSLTLREPS